MGIQTFVSRNSSFLEPFWTEAVNNFSFEGSYDLSMVLDSNQLELGPIGWFMLSIAAFRSKLDELDT